MTRKHKLCCAADKVSTIKGRSSTYCEAFPGKINEFTHNLPHARVRDTSAAVIRRFTAAERPKADNLPTTVSVYCTTVCTLYLREASTLQRTSRYTEQCTASTLLRSKLRVFSSTARNSYQGADGCRYNQHYFHSSQHVSQLKKMN